MIAPCLAEVKSTMENLLQVSLSAIDTQRLLAGAPQSDINPYVNPHAVLQRAHALLQSTQLELAEQISNFRDSESAVALLLPGVPIGMASWVPTPTQRGDHGQKGNWVSEFTLLAVGCLLGLPIGYAEEYGGELIHNIVPIKTDAGKQISSSSLTLTFHVDAAAKEDAPDFTLLLCLRQGADKRASTSFCALAPVIDALSDTDQAVLRGNRFIIRPEPVYGSARALRGPLWASRHGHNIFRFDESLVEGTDPQAQQALDRLREQMAKKCESILLRDGDLLILKNLQSAHGRAAYSAKYDGSDRWLQRSYVRAPESPVA